MSEFRDQVSIRNAIYRIKLTGKNDTVKCIICGQSAIINFTDTKIKKKNFIKRFEEKHLKSCQGVVKKTTKKNESKAIFSEWDF